MSGNEPEVGGEAMRESRAHIRALVAEGTTAICEQDAVTSNQLAAYSGLSQRTVQHRCKIDPQVEQIHAIDPETYESTYAYVLHEDGV